MNKFIKTTVSFALALSMLVSTAYASILGAEQTHLQTDICDSATLHTNVFRSPSAKVGLQTEYYFEYTPNENVRPVIVNGESIWGRRNILQAEKYMRDNGMTPIIGINADFFSTKTGIPMSHTIIDGKIISKDVTGQDSIGFRKDGTAFMAWLEIETILSTDEQDIMIENINKYRQPGALPAFLLTNDFGEHTQASTLGINVIIGNIEGEMTVGGSVTGVIEEISYYDGALIIPEGKMILTMDCDGFPDVYAKMQNLKVGQNVTITNTVHDGQELWQTADSAIGSIGGRLLRDGEIGSGFEKGTAPRTAVGITEEGKVIFYVLDGRQSGYSYGVTIQNLAERMKELGCTDAINLDGGGSSTIAGIYPGSDTMSIINSPSDGSVRKVANFIFLQNMQEPTGVAANLYLNPYSKYYLNGASVQMETVATDTANYNTELPNDIEYSITRTDSTVDENGVVTFNGEGEVVVTAYSPSTGAYGQTSLFTHSTPTEILIRNQDTSEVLSKCTAVIGDIIDLSADAYAGYNTLHSSDDLFTWSVEGNIGTIDQNAVLTVNQNAGGQGKVIVSAGEYTTSLDVFINNVSSNLKYPEIYVSEDWENNIIDVTATTIGNTLSADNIKLRIDGVDVSDLSERTQFDDFYAGLKYTTENGFFGGVHKISIEVTNSAGETSIWNSTTGVGTIESDYSDTKKHWAENTIAIMSEKGIVQGDTVKGVRYFRPNDSITRAQFAVMMCNYLGIDAAEYANKNLLFDDSSALPTWAENQIKAMCELKIINGKTTDTGIIFDPNGKLTRAEAATILSRIMPEGLYAGPMYFDDNDDIPDWATTGFKRLVTSGVITGYEDNTLKPTKHISRAEALTLLYNIM